MFVADVQGSGMVAKDDIMAIVNVFIQLADRELPVRDRLKGLVVALFRVFDTNGNGTIESLDINEIISDIISGIASILTSVIVGMEPELLKANNPPHPSSSPWLAA